MNRRDIVNHKKSKRKFKVKYTLSLIMLALSLMIAIPLATGINLLKNLDGMYDKDKKDTTVTKAKEKYNGKFGFLILGVDNSDDDNRGIGDARTDSMIYGTFNSKTKEIDMVSIPRDVYTDIYSNGQVVATDKINSAYIYNKEQSTIETVEKWLGVPIDYYATVDFDAFKDIVDAVGGVTVNVPYDMNEHYEKDNSGKTLIPKGDNQKLNGEQALIFSRIRKVDNDIKRGERQQEVIKSMTNEFIKNPSMETIDKVTKVMGKNVHTNLDYSTMIKIAMGMDNKYNMETHVFDWTDFQKDGMSMVDVYADSKDYISHIFKVALDMEEKDERDVEGYKFTTNGYSQLREMYGAYTGGV